MEKRPHMDPETCPGQAYFERKDLEYREDIRAIFTEVIGDIPKTLKMVGENRVWLWVLSAGLFAVGVITGIILINI